MLASNLQFYKKLQLRLAYLKLKEVLFKKFVFFIIKQNAGFIYFDSVVNLLKFSLGFLNYPLFSDEFLTYNLPWFFCFIWWISRGYNYQSYANNFIVNTMRCYFSDGRFGKRKFPTNCRCYLPDSFLLNNQNNVALVIL